MVILAKYVPLKVVQLAGLALELLWISLMSCFLLVPTDKRNGKMVLPVLFVVTSAEALVTHN